MLRLLVAAMLASCVDVVPEEPGPTSTPDEPGPLEVRDDMSLLLLKKKPDGLILMGGQSNTVGQGDTTEVDASYSLPEWRVWLDDYLILNPVGPIIYQSSKALAPRPVNHFGFEAAIGRLMPTYGIVRYAEGSTSLAVDWAPGSSLRNGMIALGHAVEARVGVPVRKIVWGQGENDATDSAYSLAYQANQAQLIAELATEFPNARFYYYKVPPVGTFNANVRAGQTANQSANAIMIDVDDVPRVGFHFTSAGILTVGTRFVGVMAP